jgi:hypothetical protein
MGELELVVVVEVEEAVGVAGGVEGDELGYGGPSVWAGKVKSWERVETWGGKERTRRS